MLFGIIIGLFVGFVIGILVGRKNKQKVEKYVAEGKEQLDKAKSKIS